MSVLRPASQLALRWMTQLDSLKAMVASDPDSFHAWRWLILIKVLSFLVSRYGDDAQIDLAGGLPATPPRQIRLTECSPRRLRSQDDFQPALLRIAAANQLRRST